MEAIALPIQLVWAVKRSLQRGQSVKEGLVVFMQSHKDPWLADLQTWIWFIQQGKCTQQILQQQSSHSRRLLLLLLERGLRGEPIYETLIHFESELCFAAEKEVEEYLLKLPIKVMVPLLLLQFPAFMLLLFGPLMQNFLQSLSSQ